MNSHSTQIRAQPTAAPSTGTQALLAALAAGLLGMLIIWVVGFSSAEAVHNAAHDTRHSHAFPCH